MNIIFQPSIFRCLNLPLVVSEAQNFTEVLQFDLFVAGPPWAQLYVGFFRHIVTPVAVGGRSCPMAATSRGILQEVQSDDLGGGCAGEYCRFIYFIFTRWARA